MANTAADRRSAKAAIVTALEGLTSPTITPVLTYEPLVIPFDRVAAVFYVGEDENIPEGQMTLGNLMIGRRFVIRVYWRIYGVPEVLRETFEEEMEDTERNIMAALWVDHVLDGYVSYFRTGPNEAGYVEYEYQTPDGPMSAIFRALTIPITLVELEAEAIG